MSYQDPNGAYATQQPYARPVSQAEQAVIDQGLRSYMLGIYNHMTLGLAITGLAAIGIYMLAVASDPPGRAINFTPLGVFLYTTWFKWVLALSPLAFVLVLSFGIGRMSTSTATLAFYAFAAVMGASMSTLFLVYAHGSIAQVFFITAATFAGISLWSYTTKRDLSGMGSFLMMGLIGLIIASIVNIFLGSGMLAFIISVVGVLVFSGLTAWDTQRLKNEYIYFYSSADGEAVGRSSIFGALSLYLNFVNLFQMLLALLGQREE